MIGWNGTRAAANTDRAPTRCCRTSTSVGCTNIRTDAPAQVFNDGDLTVAPSGANIPHSRRSTSSPGSSCSKRSAGQPRHSRIDRRRRRLQLARCAGARCQADAATNGTGATTDLVVIVGHDLVDDKYFNIAQETGATATEVEATDRIMRFDQACSAGFPACACRYSRPMAHA